IRVGVQEQFEFSGNPVFLYRNTFLTTTADGQLVQIDQQGKVKRSDLNLSEDHKIFATSKTLVTLDENELGIKQKSVELDFGQYTEPRIHYINDKIYVSCTDLQSQKAYLFDSQAEPIENFPVYGNSTLDLDNADADRNLEFIVRGETNTIVMYKKN
ncbi:MAG: ribonuclease HII, partial [Bacteroidia bacterium]|nr:ribonuclease HII [Bacteroidia bacterium]